MVTLKEINPAKDEVNLTIIPETRHESECEANLNESASPEISEGTGLDENFDVTNTEDKNPDCPETPLDLTIQVTKKRKLVDLELSEDHAGPGGEDRTYKRLRPSVISFATTANRLPARNLQIHTSADPAEHFQRALGSRLYNMIYGAANGNLRARRDGRCPCLVHSSLSREYSSVDAHFRKSLGNKTWLEIQGLM